MSKTDELLQSYLEYDLTGIDLLKIRMDSTWLISVLNGGVYPAKVELIGLLREIERLTDIDFIQLEIRYTWWLY